MAQAPKDTVYVDVDDEITAIIDKVTSSDKKIVALVLPKRAAVLQSSVNMKLLKRSADDAKKSIVLITSESGLMPLAGVVGLHVAKTLQSKPAIPDKPEENATPDEDIEDTELDGSKPVGELADDSIDIDNELEEVEAAPKTKKTGKLKIPNFDKFRLRVVLAVVAIVSFIIAFIFAVRVLPEANVLVKTNVTSVRTEVTFTADPSATELNEEESIVPAKKQEEEKTETEKVSTTGEKNIGEKATGSVTLSVACADVSSFPMTIPAGTGVITNNLTFVTNETITLSTPGGGGGCTFRGSGTVTAQNAGDQYNVEAGRNFAVAGYSAVTGTNDDDMTGGTNKIVKIVTQKDVDTAKTRINEKNQSVRDELRAQLEEAGYYPLDNTFNSGKQNTISSPKVGDEATEVSVSVTATYSMVGAKRDDIGTLIEKSVSDEIDTSKQQILDNGLGAATVKTGNVSSSGRVETTITTSVTAGAQQDAEAIKQEIAGKKKNESLNAIKSRPGVSDAEITYSPFWVSSTPKNTSKINVEFEQITSDVDGN